MTMSPLTSAVATVGSLLDDVARALASPAEARWLVASVVGVSAAELAGRRGQPAPRDAVDAAGAMVRRRLSGEPLQYVLGTWTFRALEVDVDPRVLIPRPETEVVAEVALQELRRVSNGVAEGNRLIAVDLGTGSGVIALSLAAEASTGRSRVRGELDVWATDVSAEAIEVARTNLAALGARDADAAGRVRIVPGSWFEALPATLRGAVHLVVSNPPYVATSEWLTLDAGVREHEPRVALVSGPTGRESLEAVLDEARHWLAAPGSVVLELAPQHADGLARRAAARGYEHVQVLPDLAGRARVLVARWPAGAPT